MVAVASASLKSRFDVAVAALLATEGGLVDNPSDPGGLTKFGISLRFLLADAVIPANRALLDINHDGKIDGHDIRALTPTSAAALYRRCFWNAAGLGKLPPPLDAIMLDQCVNMGPGTALRLLRDCLGGKATTRATIDDATDALIARFVRDHGMPALVVAYKTAARTHYRAIAATHPKLAKFLKGWLRRVERLGGV